jgi:hypothetical protein
MADLFISLAEGDDGMDLADAGVSFDSPVGRNAARRVVKLSTTMVPAGWERDAIGIIFTVGTNRKVIIPWHRVASVKLES